MTFGKLHRLSLGPNLTALEMILGYPPFWDDSPIRIYEKIIAGRISFPVWLQPEVRDIVQRLCTKDLSSRLGNMRGGGFEVMTHPFFTGIDWRLLESRKHDVSPCRFGHCVTAYLADMRKQGPLVPDLRYPEDTRYFETYDPSGPSADEEYTESMFAEHDHVFRGF